MPNNGNHRRWNRFWGFPNKETTGWMIETTGWTMNRGILLKETVDGFVGLSPSFPERTSKKEGGSLHPRPLVRSDWEATKHSPKAPKAVPLITFHGFFRAEKGSWYLLLEPSKTLGRVSGQNLRATHPHEPVCSHYAVRSHRGSTPSTEPCRS